MALPPNFNPIDRIRKDTAAPRLFVRECKPPSMTHGESKRGKLAGTLGQDGAKRGARAHSGAMGARVSACNPRRVSESTTGARKR